MRDEWLKAVGFDPQSYADAGDALAVSRIDIKFLAPLRTGDTFTGTAKLVKLSAARFELAQQLIRQPKHSSDPPLVRPRQPRCAHVLPQSWADSLWSGRCCTHLSQLVTHQPVCLFLHACCDLIFSTSFAIFNMH